RDAIKKPCYAGLFIGKFLGLWKRTPKGCASTNPLGLLDARLFCHLILFILKKPCYAGLFII
ncbi:MAG: hypothetical protein ACK47D_13210, partial [Pseudanabaena sp.]